MIALIDYGIGNLRSVEKALQAAGGQVVLTSDPQVMLRAEKVVLPGVGAFGDGMRGLQERALVGVLGHVRENGVPLLGICLGMQLLFEGSDEAPGCPGLGFLTGQVRRFPGEALKVPQTGWNQVIPVGPDPLLQDLPPGSYAYFNHSYYCEPDERSDWLASTAYGLEYASAVRRGALYGVQFHPEKSQAVGLKILGNFVRLPS
jgi:imidazole glycerol-phosphate synthase subunit HisH